MIIKRHACSTKNLGKPGDRRTSAKNGTIARISIMFYQKGSRPLKLLREFGIFLAQKSKVDWLDKIPVRSASLDEN